MLACRPSGRYQIFFMQRILHAVQASQHMLAGVNIAQAWLQHAIAWHSISPVPMYPALCCTAVLLGSDLDRFRVFVLGDACTADMFTLCNSLV